MWWLENPKIKQGLFAIGLLILVAVIIFFSVIRAILVPGFPLLSVSEIVFGFILIIVLYFMSKRLTIRWWISLLFAIVLLYISPAMISIYVSKLSPLSDVSKSYTSTDASSLMLSQLALLIFFTLIFRALGILLEWRRLEA